MVPLKTWLAPIQIRITVINLSRNWVRDLAVMEILPTRNCMLTALATLSSHCLRRRGSIAIDLTVAMPLIVSTSIACRFPSAS